MMCSDLCSLDFVVVGYLSNQIYLFSRIEKMAAFSHVAVSAQSFHFSFCLSIEVCFYVLIIFKFLAKFLKFDPCSCLCIQPILLVGGPFVLYFP